MLLGSASNALLQQTSESLAGRIYYTELAGLNPFEIESPMGQSRQTLWVRGGFPNSYTAPNDRASYSWRQAFIRTYLERDIPQLGPRIPATTLRRLWIMLAHNQGDLLNASKLAGSLGIASTTVTRYIDLMVDWLLVRRLDPWYGSVKKRLTKSPRTYIRDSGLTHALLQCRDYEALLTHPVFGKSWEGFVIETIINALPDGTYAYFYRTASGVEIDLVIEHSQHDYWAVDIKANQTPRLTKGFYIACDDINASQKFVIYTGDDIFCTAQNTTVLSLSRFIIMLREKAGC